MPNGKTHALATTLVAGTIGPALCLFAGQPLAQAAAFTAGCLAGLIVNPDLDVRRPTFSHWVVRRNAGQIAAWLWSLVWWPYAHLVVPTHRHPLSHLPLLGTAIRVMYLVIGLALAWWALRLLLPLPPLIFPTGSPAFWWGLGALALVDTLHTLMDLWWPFPLKSPFRRIKVF
jgi:uncharacterized metal-binding protein